MQYITLLIKPASSKCQMKCKYCFYADECNSREIKDYGIMDSKTRNLMIDNIFSYFKSDVLVNFCFQGGEPTIASLSWFKEFVSYVEENKKNYHFIKYSIQTNGMLIDDGWILFLKQNNFLVGLSIDGPCHDELRTADKNNTLNKVLHVYNKLKDNKIDVNILTVLTENLSSKPKELYDFYIKHDMNNIQIIPCLPPLNSNKNKYSLSPKSYYYFYKNIFDMWINEITNGHYRSFNLIDGIINILNNRDPMQCGLLGKCSPQFVIEADGSVYPCDFYCLDKWKIGNIVHDNLYTIATSDTIKNFHESKKIKSKLCNTCLYKNICNGGCKRQNICFLTTDYCGHKELISYIYNTICNYNFYDALNKSINNTKY